MRRCLLAVFAALVLLIVSAAAAAADWPTTCVELNDLAEAAAGRHENVGIYQRVAGANAEAACQHDHRHDVQRAFAWALGGSGAAISGTWPTTCVTLNDLAEAAAARPDNVGIYQRIFVHDFEAERACRADHRADVVETFAWAIPPPTSAVAPTPAIAPGPAPHDHPDYARVWDVAYARSGDALQAAAIAADVVGRYAVEAFLHGYDDGVQYGRWDCQWQSPACPLAPERPPPPPEPRVDPGLRDAWSLLMSTDTGTYFRQWPEYATVRVRFDVSTSSHTSYGYYSARTHTIGVHPDLWYERADVVAVTLAHELWHAVSPIPRPRDFSGCVADEVWAFIMQTLVFGELLGPWFEPWTDFEWDMWSAYDTVLTRPHGRIDFDTDVSDWPRVLNHVLYDRGYITSCRR